MLNPIGAVSPTTANRCPRGRGTSATGCGFTADDSINDEGQCRRSAAVIPVDTAAAAELVDDGLDAASARRLAADLWNTADLLDDPPQPVTFHVSAAL